MAKRKTRKKPGRVRNRDGFTLVELIVAVTLLSVALVPMASFMFYSARSVHRSKATALGTVLAREHIDELRTIPYDSIPLGSAVDTASIGTWRFAIITQVTSRTATLKEILVRVTDSNGREVERFFTLRGDNR